MGEAVKQWFSYAMVGGHVLKLKSPFPNGKVIRIVQPARVVLTRFLQAPSEPWE